MGVAQAVDEADVPCQVCGEPAAFADWEDGAVVDAYCEPCAQKVLKRIRRFRKDVAALATAKLRAWKESGHQLPTVQVKYTHDPEQDRAVAAWLDEQIEQRLAQRGYAAPGAVPGEVLDGIREEMLAVWPPELTLTAAQIKEIQKNWAHCLYYEAMMEVSATLPKHFRQEVRAQIHWDRYLEPSDPDDI